VFTFYLPYIGLLRCWGGSLEHFSPSALSFLQLKKMGEYRGIVTKEIHFLLLMSKKVYGLPQNMLSDLLCAFSHSKH